MAERLRNGQATRVLEIGFGLGLNALLSCDAAIANNTPLSYHACEHDYSICELNQRLDFTPLLEKPDLATVLQKHLKHVTRNVDRLAQYDAPPAVATESNACGKGQDSVLDSCGAGSANQRACTIVNFSPNTTLNLHWGDAATGSLPAGKFNAIYLDAFSPDNNPECWTLGFFERLKLLMARDAKLSTYCAKGSVRRAFIASGFVVKKLPGPPGKREIMVASLTADG